MITVSSSELDTENGLTGRKFAISGQEIDTEVFFGLPPHFRSFLSWRDDIILPYLGALALVHGQDIEVDFKVDPEFLRNVQCALREMARMHGGMRAPSIFGSVPDSGAVEVAKATAVFFSGGIDSFFSLLRLHEKTIGIPDLQDSESYAIHMYHTNNLLEPNAFNTLGNLAETAQAFGIELIPIQSNFMTADMLLRDRWAGIGHGAGLATVLHLLSAKLKVGIIASSHTFGGLMPWGSSPFIDPLWSSQRMKIIHDDSRYSRVEKTALVARSPEALAHLNVCDNRVDGSGYVNCSHCPKCLRTMVTLDLLGVRSKEQAPCFDWSDYSPAEFSKVFLRTDSDAVFAVEIRELANRNGRKDIETACDSALSRGKSFRMLSRTEDLVKNTAIGRKYRDSLREHRTRFYRAMGWATKPG